jgi:hypothetical protein
MQLLSDISDYPAPAGVRPNRPARDADYAGVAVPFQLITDSAILAFFSTTTIFGTPVDITLSELALESFFPADAATAERLRRLAEASPRAAAGRSR